ncbi:hypothetical protein MtrunA17_Chr7g0244921 [Medicago truncatula]|uniref:DUF7356 domain-containing protein n=1 Tax=Medicago truncatula TaxID=3880 RepID=A0A396GZZ9_MEDTR|nr:hypothetical protein MtrunA17_Chr7g0244921 [Medicago truncatula]
MGKHTLLILLLFSLILFHGSHASFLKDLRKLIDSTKDSLIPEEKKLDPNKTAGEEKKNDVNIPPVPTPQPLPKVENNNGENQKETNNKITNTPPPVPATAPPPPVLVTAPPPPVPATAPPPLPKKDEGKGQVEEKGKNEGIKLAHSTTNDTCEGLHTCRDDGDMVACISKMDSKNFVVLLQNRGGGTIKVKLRSDLESNLGDIVVDKNKTEKVTIKQIKSESTELTLDAGKGDCVLHVTVVTPVPEAITWACCCIFKKKPRDEIPYQELEMALPESASATVVESAEGWDQGWDDDWDDNVAVKSPVVRHAGSISANGLTSRSSNKDGWEDNWDD